MKGLKTQCFKQMDRQARKVLSYKVEIFHPTPLHERCSDGSTALWAQVLTEFGPSWFKLDYFGLINFFFFFLGGGGGGGVLSNISLMENVCIVVCICGE